VRSAHLTTPTVGCALRTLLPLL